MDLHLMDCVLSLLVGLGSNSETSEAPPVDQFLCFSVRASDSRIVVAFMAGLPCRNPGLAASSGFGGHSVLRNGFHACRIRLGDLGAPASGRQLERDRYGE